MTTQAVMTVSPVEKPVASAAYGFVRFIGGGLAPYAAGRLAALVTEAAARLATGGDGAVHLVPHPGGRHRGAAARA